MGIVVCHRIEDAGEKCYDILRPKVKGIMDKATNLIAKYGEEWDKKDVITYEAKQDGQKGQDE